MEESEFREPAVLMLQAWDYDRISSNDFLGLVHATFSEFLFQKPHSAVELDWVLCRFWPAFAAIFTSILLFHLSGSTELRLSEMVRPAKTASKCTIEMAKDRAAPRFSIFRAKKMKGWWPLVRMKTAEDFEREEKERRKRKKKKSKDKRSKLRQEDIQYTDNLGNTFLLMVNKTLYSCFLSVKVLLYPGDFVLT